MRRTQYPARPSAPRGATNTTTGSSTRPAPRGRKKRPPPKVLNLSRGKVVALAGAGAAQRPSAAYDLTLIVDALTAVLAGNPQPAAVEPARLDANLRQRKQVLV